ncbi:MAG TPA: lysylphosphatidylglycerol synthase transmembrane domain-containing protein [Bradyrhizobium sp.]|uniref:lysylphosphatidylglycerol synthase transmembrane domain-containing protein n=1 Tax=Bradyrhizobium sp. TaxID=376 RepID=UPI002C0E9F7E|nr:lysylphosphatidylglycerol synthase transmembrane domain-containing protein [Bradyrhizobium sp.]HLZ03223.1 lysylphosphatidylglycerol synthase transmembrane domain-containing protein [Bradyrhizobium sp.]
MRRFLTLSGRIAVSLALLYVALRGINFAAIQSRLTRISLGWMGFALLIAVLQCFLSSLRWREISAQCAAPLTDPQAFRYNMIGAFFNQTLPSSIGGDAVRLWLVNRTGAGWRAATYSVLTDRAIGHIALALVIVVSLPWSYGLIADDKGRLALLAVDAVALAGGLGFLLVGHLDWIWLKRWWPTRHVQACSVIANRVLFGRKSGPKIAVTSLSVHVLSVVIAWCVVRAIAASADFEELFMLTPPILLITMVPISIAGWGLREATMMIAFGYAGLSQTEGTVVSILFGAVYFALGATGGLVWIFSSEKTAQTIELAPVEDS